MEKEISERMAALTRRLQKLHFWYKSGENDVEIEEDDVGIITLIGNNEGAAMNVQGSSSYDVEEKSMVEAEHLVNSNVQSFNNSIMFESSCNQRDSGVHFNVHSFSQGGNFDGSKSKPKRRRNRSVRVSKDEEWKIPSSKTVLDFLSGSSEED